MCKSSKMVSGSTRVIQVTNIAPQATKDQMQTLFGYLGKIDDIRLYPTIRDVSCPVQSRICYVKYYDSATVNVAQHMTNTVFIDRALIVIPMQSGEIPDEHKALEMSSNGTLVPGLSTVEPRLPAHVINALDGVPPNQVIQTHDPKLTSLGLPPYPPLPAAYDSRKIEEIRRTLLVGDVDSLTSQQLIDHFCLAGEVKYMRFCERDADKQRYALIEMTEQESILKALQLNGSMVDGHAIKVYHATQAICKPQTKSNEAAQREIEEAMCRVKEAQNLISAAIDPVIGLLSKDKRRTRSRSRSRRRSRSRSRRSRSRHRSKRSRSRSRHRSRRSRSRHKHRSSSRRSRSRSRHRSSRSKRDRSRDKDKDKDKDKDRKDKKESTDKEKKEKSKSPPKEVEKEEKEEVKPEVVAETNGNSSEGKSKASTPADDKPEKDVEKEKERSPSKKRERTRSRDRKRDRSRSRRRSRSRSRRKRSRSRRRSRSRDRKRSRSRDRKRSRSRDRKRSRSRDRKRTRSRDRKRSKSRDKKRSRSRDRKRSRSGSRHSKSRSHRDSKTPHDRKSRDHTPNLSVIEEKDISTLENKISDVCDEKNSPDNMDISNSP
uniref:RRM domain-containing protein n=1 Tax=Heliothis virescens TaxID=7102 RepID=A0A2A4K9M7_HELVI